MKRKITHILLVVFLCLSGTIFTQTIDNFTDGNFTLSPSWSGNDTDFIVNPALQLQLNSSGSGTSHLKISNSHTMDNCEWNFWIRLNFSPSSSNYARVYLASDQPDLAGPLNGYYLRFGETGSADKVELFAQAGNTSTSVCRAVTSIANAFSIRVKVLRDNTGLWQIYIDTAGNTNYVLEANGTDNSFSGTSYFGVYCRYTATNAANFFFDDFYIYAPPDSIPAALDSVATISSSKVDAYFSEAITTVSAQTAANYSCDNGIGFAAAAVLDSMDPRLVHLTMAHTFVNGQYYTLQVTGVQDLAGNNTLNSTKQFFFFLPAANDIVINEVMADINPIPSGLPAYEYLELYNRTNYAVKLSGWTISDASSTVTVPDIIIQPDSFYVLTSTAGAAAYGTSLQAAGVINFPSLNDAGDNLILRDNFGNIISFLYYTAEWYNDPIKDDGGWSMEQIDPNSPCAGLTNWRACADNAGGTPGKTNSVNASVGDLLPPVTSHCSILDTNIVQLFFSEPMDSTTLLIISNYSIDNGMGAPVAANPVEPDYTSVMLSLASNAASATIYTITVNGVRDCASNLIGLKNTAQFGKAEPATNRDVIINEVMFDPKENGVEWIELYNRSARIIDLKEIYFCSRDNTGNLSEVNQAAAGGYLILPGAYVVLSKDASAIKAQYTTTNTEGFIDMADIPSLNNDSDWVVLANASQTVIDQVHYYPEWHLPLLNDPKGISLERISYDHNTQDEHNWHSASESSGYATPACKNSQHIDGESGNEITVSPEVFSPDNDGYNDVLTISYTFDSPGMVGNIQVYDSRGRLTKTLVRNELLSTSGTFFWDGITDDKLKARIGIYILYFETFDAAGNVKKFKKTCVVGGKL